MAYPVPFSQQQAFAAKYWYEKLQYTWGPQSLPTGDTPIFNVSRLNRTEIPQWAAELSNVGATQNSGVALDFTFDRHRIPALVNQGHTDAFPSGLRTALSDAIGATGNISLLARNSNASAVANFQINYQVAMRRLTVADKLVMGIDKFTADELEALNDKSIDVRGLVEKGIHPIPIEDQVRRTYKNRARVDFRLLHVDASTSDTAFLTIRASEFGQDRFLVLRELAIEGGAAVVVSVDRDDDLNYMGVNGAAFAEADDRPWDVFVPALHYLTFHIQAAAPISKVPIRIVVWHVKWSNILRVRFGLAGRGDVPDNTYLRAIAGVV